MFEHEYDKSDGVLLSAPLSIPPNKPEPLSFNFPRPNSLSSNTSSFPAAQNADALIVHRNDLRASYIFSDEFSRIDPPAMLDRPSCIVSLTDELRAGYEWARRQHGARARGEAYETRYYPPR